MRLKSFCTAKETSNKMKRQLTKWENMFTNDSFHKGSVSKIYKELIQFNMRKKKPQQSDYKMCRGSK